MPIEIKTTEELKKHLESEQTARLELEKKLQAEAEARAKMEIELKDNREKLAEVTSKNWVEKFSTKDSKEETLFGFGKLIQGLVTRNKETIEKYGVGKGIPRYLDGMYIGNEKGGWISKDQEIDREFIVQKSKLGTPLYSDATTGSYLIPVEYAAEVMYVAKQSSQMMGLVREVPMAGITKYVPKQNAAASFSWLTLQSSAKSEVNPTFDRTTLTSQTAGIYTSITEELEEDSLVNVAAYFRDIFGEAWGYEFDYQSTQSNAAPFTGMLIGATNVLTLAAGQTTFSDVKFDDLYDAVALLTTENKRTGARWIMHCTVFDILRKIKDANGQYLYQRPDGNQPGTLCGYPYTTCDGMIAASSTGVSTKFIIFGNPKYFLFGNRTGLEFKVFPDTYYAATEDQIIFRGRVRAAFATALGGSFVAIRTAAS